ncbi:hypothetical protein ACFQFH_02790 [Halobaculum halobium]|uniref:Intracellular proteinase inhibitor n=1 Tax=Halobaculum halobium TaxID=3032281 RepID=A0ABD5TBF6_9EURY|nr:hypothetical protein [Halobaculum sp. SYNS20]
MTEASTSDGAVKGSGAQLESPRPQVSDAIPEERVIPTTVEIRRLNETNTVHFTYEFDLPSDTVEFRITDIDYIERYSVVETTGFEDNQKLTWDTTTAAPSLTIAHPLPNDSNAGMHRVTVPSPSGEVQREDPPDERFVDSVYEEPVGFHQTQPSRFMVRVTSQPSISSLVHIQNTLNGRMGR